MNLFNSKNILNQQTVHAKYVESFDCPFSTLTNAQLKDEALWSILVRQFFVKNDALDNGWRGEYWGKLMRGACLVYAYNQDKQLYDILENATRNLLRLIDQKGRLATYVIDKEFAGWDMWARKYVMLGLEYFYEICFDQNLKTQILSAIISQADYILEKIGSGEGQISINKTSTAHGAINSVSIIQPFVCLYKITKNSKYLDFAKNLIKCQEVDGENIFALAFNNQKAPFEYPVTKAYEMTSCFEGLLDFYEQTNNKDCLTACVNFANKVLETDFTLIGGTGCVDEFFDNSTKTQVIESEINKQETCVAVTLMKFLIALYKKTDDVRYIDAVEKTYLNLYLGSLRDGRYTGSMEQPIFYSYSPVLNNPRWRRMGGARCISTYARFGCCIAIGAAGAGITHTVGAMANSKGVTLNFFYGGDYSLSEKGENIEFSVVSNYPQSSLVTVNVKSANGVDFRCRKPDWCEKFSLLLNGKSAEYSVKDGYIYLNDKVSAGDQIVLDLDMPVKVIPSTSVNPEVNNLFALAKGPIMLCADGNEVDLTAKYDVETDEFGNAVVESFDGQKYIVKLQDGNTLPLGEYKNTGKCYPDERSISVWLYK